MLRLLIRPPEYTSARYRLMVIFLALLPFITKTIALGLGLTGYLFHSTYKIFQLLAPVLWRYKNTQAQGWKIFWPVEEPLPTARVWSIAIILAVVLGLLGVFTTTVVTQLLGLDLTAIQTQLNNRFGIGSAGAVIIVILLATFNAGLEELHFRYWLDRELTKMWGPMVGICASAFAFGVMHLLILAGTGVLSLITQLIILVALFIAGVSWSLLARQPGGIHAAWLSHGLTNVILMGWGLHWLGYI